MERSHHPMTGRQRSSLSISHFAITVYPRFAMLILLLLGGWASAAPLTVPLSPLSPLINYDPITYSGNEAEGWSWAIPKIAWDPPMLGDGAKLNVSLVNATLKANFTGTGMSLLGRTTANTSLIRMWDNVELTAEREPYTFDGAYEVNLAADGHAFGKSEDHSWGLRLIRGSLLVEQVSVHTQIDVAYTTAREAPALQQETVLSKKRNNHQFFWSGAWTPVEEFDPGRFNDKQPHVRGKPGAQVTWEVPDGVAFMAIDGFVGHQAGTYDVSVLSSVSGSNDDETEWQHWTYNANRPFEIITPLFITPLDPKTHHTVTLKNTDADATLQFRSVNYTFTNQDEADKFELLLKEYADKSKKGHDLGAIIGGTIGGVVGAALLAAGIFFFFRRRKRSAAKDAERSGTRLDLAADPVIMPFRQPSQPAAPAPATRDSHALSSEDWNESTVSGATEPKIGSPRVQQDTDAGVLMVPPSYDPAWAEAPLQPQPIPMPVPAPASAPSSSAMAATDTSGMSSSGKSEGRSETSSRRPSEAPQFGQNEKAQFAAALARAEEQAKRDNEKRG